MGECSAVLAGATGFVVVSGGSANQRALAGRPRAGRAGFPARRYAWDYGKQHGPVFVSEQTTGLVGLAVCDTPHEVSVAFCVVFAPSQGRLGSSDLAPARLTGQGANNPRELLPQGQR